MDKNLILKNFNLSNEDKVIFSKIIDDINKCIKTKENKFTHFLDPYKINIFKEIFLQAKFGIDYKIFGGFSNTERNILGFYCYDLKEGDFPIKAIKIEYNTKFSKNLTHRDFLGSIIGMGLSRNVIGDILVKETHAIAIVSSSIVSYLSNNLKKIGSSNVVIKEVDLNNIDEVYDEKNSNKTTVTSLRIDNVVCGVFKISRSNSTDLIKSGKVFVNWSLIKSGSKSIQENDIITVRGLGRIKIEEFLGKSKKDKFIIKYYMYI